MRYVSRWPAWLFGILLPGTIAYTQSHIIFGPIEVNLENIILGVFSVACLIVSILGVVASVIWWGSDEYERQKKLLENPLLPEIEKLEVMKSKFGELKRQSLVTESDYNDKIVEMDKAIAAIKETNRIMRRDEVTLIEADLMLACQIAQYRLEAVQKRNIATMGAEENVSYGVDDRAYIRTIPLTEVAGPKKMLMKA